MNFFTLFAGESITSIATTIVLIGTNIASFVGWKLEKNKRKYDDIRAKVSIVDELSAKNEKNIQDIFELREQMMAIKLELNSVKTKSQKQEERIKELETENQQLKENQQKLIKENEQLKYTVECMKYAGKKKQPVPKKKDTPCSN